MTTQTNQPLYDIVVLCCTRSDNSAITHISFDYCNLEEDLTIAEAEAFYHELGLAIERAKTIEAFATQEGGETWP